MLVSHGVHEDRLVRGVHPIYPQVKVSPEITLQQGAAHHRDEIQSPVAVKCSSCGKTSPSNSSHPVNYKTIIAHFEQVIDLVSRDPANRSGVVEWPPSAEILEATGGVGFGDIALAANIDPSRITTEDVIVPPVIRFLHPKLASEGYERHRRDPLFLYKTAFVCEACFLVYAELASLAFRATGRQAVTDHTMSTQFSAIHRSSTLSRLKLSEGSWQPLLKKKKCSFGRAKISCVAVPQQPAPDLPDPIRRHEDVQAEGIQHSSAGKFIHTPVDKIIREREQEFFRELVAEGHSGTHPLQHMVASHQKLAAVGAPVREVDHNAVTEKFRANSEPSPYEQPQVLVEYMSGSATQTVESRTYNSAGRKHHQGNRDNGISASATRHRQFLAKTLNAVREQLESTVIEDISTQDAGLGRSKGAEHNKEVLSAKDRRSGANIAARSDVEIAAS